MKIRTETVKHLTGWDLAAIEWALQQDTRIDAVSRDRLIEAIRKADGGKLTRRVANPGKLPEGVIAVPLDDPATIHNTLKTILGED
jgi:hypothetical protein